MKKILLFILIVSITTILYAQNTEIDSLESLLAKTSGIQKIDILNELILAYTHKSLDKSIEYSKQSLELSKELNYIKGEILSLMNIGLVYCLLGEHEIAIAQYGKIVIEKPKDKKVDPFINENWRNKADSLLNISIEYYQKAFKISKLYNEDNYTAEILYLIGVSNKNLENYTEALGNFLNSLEIKKKNNNKDDIALSFYKLGSFYKNCIGNYKKAIVYFQEALKLYEDIDNIRFIEKCTGSIGMCYSALKDYHKALEYDLKSLKLMKKIGLKNAIANITNRVGLLYSNIGNYEKSTVCFQEAIEISEEWGFKDVVGQSYFNFGRTSFLAKDYTKAIEYLKESLKIREELGQNNGIIYSLYEIGFVYEKLGNHKKALEYYQGSLQKAKKVDFQDDIIKALHHIANIYKKLNNEDKTLFYLKQGLMSAKEFESKEDIRDFYKSLSDFYFSKGDFNNTFEFLNLYSEIKDSVHIDEINMKEANALLANKLREQEVEVVGLQHENKITELELNKKRLQSKSLLIGLILLSLLAYLIYYRYRLKRKINIQLEQKIEEALKKQREQQQIIFHQSSLTSLGELAAGIAHEINQPLTSISFTNENLQHKILNKKLDEKYLNKKIQKISDNIERIQSIVDHIRTFSSKQKEDFKGKFSINESINNALSMVREQFNHHSIEIKVELDNNISLITGNLFKLEQIVINFIKNSKDALEEKEKSVDGTFAKWISIKSFETEKFICFEIEDNGIGISAENKKDIFTPFFTTKELGKGTGLGLSISLSIIKEMNGFIDVESQPFELTKIKVRIPK